MRNKLVGVVVLLCVALGCVQSKTEHKSAPPKDGKQSASPAQAGSSGTVLKDFAGKANPGRPEVPQPFWVYQDKGSRENHYIPSGFMPDGKCISFDDGLLQNCHSGKTCIKIIYDVTCSKDGQKWAGIRWLNPANNWGSQKGGYNLTGFQKLTFWAKGEKGNERIEEFNIGGITGEYPDSDTAVIGPVILTPEWKEYTIDLRGKDISSISGGFTWSTSVEVNPENCTFYLDDIQYQSVVSQYN